MEGAFVIKCGGTVLADGRPDGAIVTAGPDINGQRMLDIAPMLLADRPTIFDREGDSDTVSFTIARQHGTLVASLDHALRHGRATRGVADLVIELVEGGVTRQWVSKEAGWQAHQVPAPEGYTTAFRYTVICGGFTAPEGIDGNELSGDIDGGDEATAYAFTGDVDGLAGNDDDAAVIEIIDGGLEFAA